MSITLSSVLTGPEKWVKGHSFVFLTAGGSSIIGDQHHWTQCCLIGATYVVNDFLKSTLIAIQMAIEELGFKARMDKDHEHQAKHPVALFNDHKDTVWEDVAAVCKRADQLLQEPMT